MKISYDYPPNYEIIKKAFNLGEHENVVFTYGDTLHVPQGEKTKIDKPLMAHEETHALQQSKMTPQWWWDEFMSNPQFRLEQELEAYREQYKAMQNLPAQKRANYLTHIATDLSSEIYGKLLTFEQAVAVITEGIKFKQDGVIRKKTRDLKKMARQNRKKGRK